MARGARVGRALALARTLALSMCAAAACSSSGSRPPLLADCQANDAGCSTQAVSGGGGSGADAATATCEGMDLGGSSQCTQCGALRCCDLLSTCLNDTVCLNLLNCEESCGALASCVTMCQQRFIAAEDTFDALEVCLAEMCTVCGESGIGDPCSGTATGCAPGLTCIDGWCSQACTASSTCVGLGPDGTSAIGLANACLTIAAVGDVCVPGCATDADCVDFADTFCLSTTAVDGTAVQVCSRAADSGP